MFSRNNDNTVPVHFREKLPKIFKEIKEGRFDKDDPDYALHLYLQESDIKVQAKNSEIVKFLQGKHILITGGTGFLGKLLIEKILRACEDVTIFLIIREKRGKSLESRIDELVNSYVFRKLSDIRPQFRKNIIGINGDMSAPGLNLSKETRNTLTDKINIIYHVAATTRFDEALKTAIQINILGTKDVIGLAKDCKNLDAVVHVSTAFANSHRHDIFEEVYDPLVNVDELLKLSEFINEDLFNKCTPALLGTVPNTYVYTKQIAEYMVKKEALGAVPACICRPAIVLSTLREPVPGWGEQVFGAIGYLIASGLGLVHVSRANPQNRADMVPADFVVNNMIAASYRTAQKKNLEKIAVYNCVSSPQNPIRWYQVSQKLVLAKHFGIMSAIFDPFFLYIPNIYLFGILNFLFHTMPAFLVDTLAKVVGKTPGLQKAYARIGKYQVLMSFFIANEFNFKDSNTVELYNSLNEVDKVNFNFDIGSYDWYDYYCIFVGGVKEFILGEPMENLEKGRAYGKRLLYIRWALTFIFLLPVIFILYKIICLF